MATGDLIKLGGLYLKGVLRSRPLYPWGLTPPGASGTKDVPSFTHGEVIEIKDTPSNDAQKLQWIEVNENGKKYLISDRVILVNVSYNDLNSQNLIAGKQITIDNQKFLLRVLTGGTYHRSGSDRFSGGTLPNEWDRWIVNEAALSNLPTPTTTDLDNTVTSADYTGEHNRKWNWVYMQSWCQEIHPINDRRVLRGSESARYFDANGADLRGAMYGWRPVLEVLNQEPTIGITSPTANQTIYENDELQIMGTSSEADLGDSVTVRYQINANAPRAIKAFVSTGIVEAFSKTLKFKGGSLYDGETLIASGLVDGVAHTLKVYATDDKGGQSPIVERTFYVVPNRAPSLTVNPPVITGNIDSDEIEFTGSYVEPDGNQATVSYRINGGNSVQVAQGVSGDFDFKIKFGQLKVGLNNIVVEVIDSYGAKTSRTVKLQKDEVSIEQLKSTARYRIIPPLETATGVVVWVQRDENLSLNASISMTLNGEAENFVAITERKTAPIPSQPGIVEDRFKFQNASAAENIILQLDMEKSALGANERIHAITGVVE